MKLVKVYSDGLFKNVSFNEGYNVILATIHNRESKKDTHNLGKTSLLVVIDFMLLCTYSKKNHPVLSNPIFKNQRFGLEVKLNNGKYLIIKRGLDTPSKISFKLNDVMSSDFSFPNEWDYEDVAFEKARERLNEYLGFDVLTKWPYRKSISYFLRTQKDYLDVFQLNKFKGKQIQWKPFVFDLLGFNGELIKENLQIYEDIKIKKEKIQTLQQQARIGIDERDKIVGLIDLISEKKKANRIGN